MDNQGTDYQKDKSIRVGQPRNTHTLVRGTRIVTIFGFSCLHSIGSGPCSEPEPTTKLREKPNRQVSQCLKLVRLSGSTRRGDSCTVYGL